ncbi:hypothetical protein [Halorussus sp. MSC15.2]|uniref:hypothetical protein n=1 Tax=Halorussus sp. MSC15.2 TaxID=2283638 RepID=UPI0013CF921E|nr:hypothetical protein [Halorussus sp. MSC15.2]NEU57067.1 hypothetical protein [Halorussus sp. MSC15.2]
MELTERISWRKVGVRSLVLTILAVGILLRYAPEAIFFAAVAYAVAEAVRLRSLSKRDTESFAELAASSGFLLRSGFLWSLLVLAVLYDLLIGGTFLLAFASAAFVYVGGLFAQSARANSVGRPDDVSLSASGDKG